MAQIFHPKWNVIARVTLVAIPLFLGLGLWAAAVIVRSPYATRVGEMREQPVPFSHQHHAGELGIDCRFCHQSVEKAAFAGMPATQVCMKCHSQIWPRENILSPVRESYRTGTPLQWTRVHDLPDYVYFNHSIHVNKGVGCSTCHGRIDRMPMTAAAKPLQMRWCLDCHRDPHAALRSQSEIFDMDWQPSDNEQSDGAALLRQHRITLTGLTDCTVCHR